MKEFVSVIVPCRGVDPGLKDNLRAVLSQDYPSYEVVFAVRDVSDPAYPILEDLKAESKTPVKVVVAYATRAKVDKMNNLLMAFDAVDERSAIIATMDSDVAPRPDWLGKLVSPLSDSKVGITSGYRFYLPSSYKFASYLHSIWSAFLMLFMPYKRWTSAYGGSMAFRRDFFVSYRITQLWEKSISDDMPISNRALEVGYHVVFVPECIVPSYEHSTWSTFVTWSNRQTFIIKLCALKRWLVTCILLGLWYFLVGWGITAFIAGILAGHFNAYALITVSLMIGVVIANGFLMAKAVEARLTDVEKRYKRVLDYYPIYALCAQLLSVIQIFASVFMRSVKWRGSRYLVRSAYDVDVISDAS